MESRILLRDQPRKQLANPAPAMMNCSPSTTMINTWNYVQNGQPCGPVETSALQALLRDGTLPTDTLVWQAGMPNWVAAGTLPEFAASAPPGSTMPPIPTETAAPAAGNRLRISPAPEPPLPPAAGAIPPGSISPDLDAADIEKNKVFAVLAYVGLLFLVPLLAAPQSKFARYHTNQGVVLFVTVLSIYAASVILMMIPFIGCIMIFVPMVVGAGALVMMILGIINAATGQTKPLPLIGHFRLIK